MKKSLKQISQEITFFNVYFLTLNVYLILDKLAVKILCGELTIKFNVKDISCSEISNIFLKMICSRAPIIREWESREKKTLFYYFLLFNSLFIQKNTYFTLFYLFIYFSNSRVLFLYNKILLFFFLNYVCLCIYPILLCFSGYPRFLLSAMHLPPNSADNRCSTVLIKKY